MLDPNLSDVQNRSYKIEQKQEIRVVKASSVVVFAVILLAIALALGWVGHDYSEQFTIAPSVTVTPTQTRSPNEEDNIARAVVYLLRTPTNTPTTIPSTATPDAAALYLRSLPYCSDIQESETPQACMPYITPGATTIPTVIPTATPTATPLGICIPELYGEHPEPCLLVKVPVGWIPSPTATPTPSYFQPHG